MIIHSEIPVVLLSEDQIVFNNKTNILGVSAVCEGYHAKRINIEKCYSL